MFKDNTNLGLSGTCITCLTHKGTEKDESLYYKKVFLTSRSKRFFLHRCYIYNYFFDGGNVLPSTTKKHLWWLRESQVKLALSSGQWRGQGPSPLCFIHFFITHTKSTWNLRKNISFGPLDHTNSYSGPLNLHSWLRPLLLEVFIEVGYACVHRSKYCYAYMSVASVSV